MGKQIALPAPHKPATLEFLEAACRWRDEERRWTTSVGDLVSLPIFSDAAQDLARALPQLSDPNSFHVLHSST
jgi:hypothetical protein